jgi:hypothetical protein
MLAMVSALPTVGFYVGTRLTEAKAHETMAILQTDNVVKTSEIAKKTTEIFTWSNAYQSQQASIRRQEAQIAMLTEAVGKERHCDFLRQQIESTKQDISEIQSPMMVDIGGAPSNHRDTEAIFRLEARLGRYITQLSSCTKDGA